MIVRTILCQRCGRRHGDNLVCDGGRDGAYEILTGNGSYVADADSLGNAEYACRHLLLEGEAAELVVVNGDGETVSFWTLDVRGEPVGRFTEKRDWQADREAA